MSVVPLAVRVPSDADGLRVPAPRSPDVAALAARVDGATSALAEVALLLEALRPEAALWSGTAADGFTVRQAELGAELWLLSDTARAGAAALSRWADDVVPAAAALAAARTAVDAARAAEAVQQAAGDWTGTASGRADDAWNAWEVAKRRYWDATEAAVAGLGRLVLPLRHRPLALGDHVVGFSRAAVHRVSDDAVSLWQLTGAGVSDPTSWRRAWTGVPAGWWQLLRHPVDAARETLDTQAWADGRYGEALASLGALFLPSPRWLRLPGARRHGAQRFAAHRADPQAPLPRLQDVADLLAHVDLTRHEHALLGHTLRRHVAVSEDYLMDRLAYGTLLDHGGRAHVPVAVSSYTDRATAERAVTDTLRAHAGAVRRCAARVGLECGRITLRFDEPLGVVMHPADGGFRVDDGRVAVVWLRNVAGRVVVVTSYLEE